MGFFDLIKSDTSSKARLGRMHTTRGSIDTPVFMPVGTQASVKAIAQHHSRAKREGLTEVEGE